MKKMKSVLALLLALAMVFALVACSSSSDSSSDDADDTVETEETEKTEESAEEAEEATEEAEEDTTAEQAEKSNPIHLTMATYGEENAITGMVIKYFGDYLEEHSDGEITYDLYYDNQFCSMPEMLDNASAGTIDVCDVLFGMYGDKIPYLDITISDKTASDAFALAEYLFFEDETTAPAITEQLDSVDLTAISFTCPAAIAYVCNSPISCYDDLKDVIYGAARNSDYFSACGLNVITIDGGEIYESLRLGTCDATSNTLDGIVSNMYYEPAPYSLLVPEYSITSVTCINQDTYASMTASQQALVQEAAQATMDYGAELCDELEEGYIETIETETGNAMGDVTDDEVAFIYKTELETTYQSSLAYAQNLGCEDLYRTVVETQWAHSTLNDGSELSLD